MSEVLIKPNLDLFSFNSSDPSNTINIRPIVAKTGRLEDKSGITQSNPKLSCFRPKPKAKSIMTEGILVKLEVRLKI